MIRTRFFFCLALILPAVLSLPAWTESTNCVAPVLVPADGRTTQSSFPQNATYWYGIYAQPGHSYSMEFVPAADNYLDPAKVQFAAVNVFVPSDLQACRGASSVAVTQNSGYAPVILKGGNGAGRRVSFTAQSASLYLISVTNLGGTGSYTFRAVDTTLLNFRWSTCNGYDDQWGLMNLSDMPITGTLTIYDSNSHVVVAVQVSIPAGGRAFRSSYASSLNLPRNISGYVVFTHNGPPGAVIADACLISPAGIIETYAKFEGVNGQ
jgi:hypothetical protein